MVKKKAPAKARKRKSKSDVQPDLLFTEATPDALWSLGTNHLNLLLMLGTGMVTGPSGFSGKYFSDSLSISAGWIPVFRRLVPASLLEPNTKEGAHLESCIARIDLTQIRCTVYAMRADGKLRRCNYPDQITQDDVLLLLGAPLPTALLKEAWFADDEARIAFEERSKDAGNVDIGRIDRRVDAAISDDTLTLPLDQVSELAVRDEQSALATGQARGGILAILANIANRSAIALAAYRSAFDQQPSARDTQTLARDPILAELPGWLRSASVATAAETPARLYWGVVDAIIHAKTAGAALKPIDEALRFLDSELLTLKESAYRGRLERLIKDLRSTAGGFGGGTISQLLEHNKGSFSRSILLFCLRDNCEELLEFSHPALEDAEYVLAAILFGARDGWAGLPNTLRKPQTLADFVTWWMTESVHRATGDEFELHMGLQRPVPLRELFECVDEDWTKLQKEAALELARKQKWANCIRTRITLGRGSYSLSIDGAGAHLLLDGDVKAVATLADMNSFMQALATQPVDSKMEQNIRKLMGSIS